MAVSWFNTKRAEYNKGKKIGGKKHILSPKQEPGKKVWLKTECRECRKHNAFVFGSHTDGNVEVVACFNCGAEYAQMSSKVKRERDNTCSRCGKPVPAGRKKLCFDCCPPKTKPAVKKKPEQVPLW